MKRTEVKINLDNLRSNIRIIKNLTNNTDIIAIVKADCYGHGVLGMYKTMQEEGIHHFAVAIPYEGIELRKDGLVNDEILILGDTWDEDLDDVVKYNLTPAIFNLDTAKKLNELAKKRNLIQPIHIKLDTGMSRVGFLSYGDMKPQSIKDIVEASKLSNIEIKAAFMHFADADNFEDGYPELQFKRFNEMIDSLKEAGVNIQKTHVSNTPSILTRPEFAKDFVRPGDILYGLLDCKKWEEYGFKEVMTWETYVALTKEIEVGTTVGYSRTFTAKRKTKVATIPIGFADGYLRALSNKGYVVINGKIAPIIGRVCMDQFMVDVTDIEDVKRGDKVMLLDGDLISIYKMAELIDRDVDEIVLSISKRVPRVFVEK